MPTLMGLRTRLWSARGKKPDRLHYANGGIGDELMLTAVARAARAAGRPIHLIATYPRLWAGNNDPASVETDLERWTYAARRGWINTEIVHLRYETGLPRHIASQMADHLGVELPPGWRPILHRPRTPRDSQQIVVQNSCRGARYRADTKEWSQARWQELVDRLAGEYKLVQIGTAADPVLDKVEDRRGHTSLEEAAELIAGARLFIGLESGLQHVAAAVSTPAVIVYGGRSRPDQTGYPFNFNLVRNPPCAGCGLNSGCPHNLVCLDIPTDEVVQAVRQALHTHPA